VRSLLIVLARPSKKLHDEPHFFVPQMEVEMAKLTDKFIREVQVPEGKKDVHVFDDECAGFGVRKQAGGHTTFIVKYTVDGSGQQRKKTLTTYGPGLIADLRKEAKKLIGQANCGVDVIGDAKKAKEKAAKQRTLGELVGPYLQLRETGNEFWKPLRPKSLYEVTRYLEKSWKPLHDKPITEITRQMVRDRRNEIVKESGAVSANRAQQALSWLCGWAIEQEYISGTNPTSDIKPLHEEDRDRVLSEEELVEIWLAAGDDEFGRIVKLLMLTGQRRQEIGGLEWAEVRLQRAMIDLPERRTKNKKRHLVPLSEPALALIPPSGGNGPSGPKHVFCPVHWDRGKTDLDKRITARRGAPLDPHWTLHDIRRSFVTHINELGFAEPHICEALVNHVGGSKAGVAGVYNHAVYLDQRREALEKWGRYLTGLVTAPTGAVAPVSRSLSPHQSNNPEKPEEVSTQLVSGTR
jgi:integrase